MKIWNWRKENLTISRESWEILRNLEEKAAIKKKYLELSIDNIDIEHSFEWSNEFSLLDEKLV